MNPAHNSLNNPTRLDALRRLNLLDTPPEESFDRLTRLVRQFLGVPVALVSLVDDHRQFFKAASGLGGWAGEARETPLTHSFCQHVVTSGEPLIVHDARTDVRVATNLAIPELGVIAYLGFPIRLPDGYVLGSFCAIDVKPRVWVQHEIDLMAELTQVVMNEVAARWKNIGAELALKESKDRLKQLLGWADCLIWEAEVEVMTDDWIWKINIQPSGLFFRLYGERVPPANVGLWYRFGLPDQKEMDRRCRTALLTNQSEYKQEFRVVNDGRTYWIRETVTVSRRGPNLFWLAGVATDITELHEADQARRRSEEVTRLFAEHAPASVAMFDREMRYLVHSRQWLADYQIEGESIIGKTHFEVLPEISVEWKASFQRGLAGAVEQREAECYLRADGSSAWLRSEIRPWRDMAGGIGGIVMFTQDITKQIELDQHLTEARDQAIESSRLKSEFLANMSHEIRTPMNGIIGMSGLLMESALNASQQEMGRVIQRSAENLLVIINDVLDFSKIEAGKLELVLEDFDLRLLLEETLALLSPRAKAKNLTLTLEGDMLNSVQLRGDVGRIRQVLLNLVVNAVKFTEVGGVTLVVKVQSSEAGLAILRIEVRDTGIGIPQAQQHRIFEVFSQLDASSTKSRGGTGLGLAISRQLTVLMGGKIGFQSEKAQGSVFWIELELPLAQVLPAPKPSLPAPAAAVAGANEILSGGRILVAEDNDSNQLVIQCLLEKLGYECEVVPHGRAALERLAFQQFDAVLMDCQMPEMDGYAATRQIRAGKVPGLDVTIPVIALTAYAMEGDRKKCMEAGMDDYVSKPLRSDDLRAALGRCREKRAAAAMAAADQGGLLDVDQLEQLSEIPSRTGARLLDEVLGQFIESMPGELAHLRQLAGQKLTDDFALFSHSIAATAATLGARQLRVTALKLETAGGASQWGEVELLLADLEQQWLETRSALQKFAATGLVAVSKG